MTQISRYASATLLLLTLAVTGQAAEPAAAESAAPEVSAEDAKWFETHVRPLLANSCFKCHGEEKQNGGLRLDSRAAMLVGGDSGPALVAGKPAESLLVEAINWESYEMPPSGKLEDRQIAVLTEWIRRGAPWPGGGKDAPLVKKPKITEEDRQWWAFQPVTRPNVPDVDDNGWSQGDVDRFIYRGLHDAGLTPAEQADRRTLIRRLSYDLIGLPPTPEEIAEFIADDRPDAWSRLVDRMLDSPHYGERWGQHWLDLVRYAESDGFRADHYRPQAWRYRDYVIRSFNDDKPYDQFVAEQLAGDELAPHDPDALVATGFLRHGIYEYNQRDVETQWSDIVNEVTDVTSDVFLGLGMGCARCHDHKFDPILQKDYFRLQAFLTTILPRDDLPIATPEEIAAFEQKQAKWEEATADIRRQIDEIEFPYHRNARERATIKFPKNIETMMRTPPEKRKPREHQLAQLAHRQVLFEYDRIKYKKEDAEKLKTLREQLAKFDHLKPAPLPLGQTVRDTARTAPATFIPGRRNPEPIEPGFLTILDPEPAEITPVKTAPDSTGRRATLARWITDPTNPLTARVMVNRIWQGHFGTGLVATASDFGRLGEKPSHPELLDWLASEFIDSGWSIKAMHRLMLNTAAYRQEALREAPPRANEVDPGNRLLWRMNIRRLSAEQIRDSILAVTGELQMEPARASVSATSPKRTIYTKHIRNTKDPVLDVFDVPSGFSSTPERNVTTSSTQALLMMNGEWMLSRARILASRLQRDTQSSSPTALIERAYSLLYGRAPVAMELEVGRRFLDPEARAEETPLARAEGQKPPRIEGGDGTAALISPARSLPPLRMSRHDALPSGDFTIEARIVLHSMYSDATVRTIVSQWDNNQKNPGWSFGVTSIKSAYKPGNLILQLVGQNSSGNVIYEVVPSNIHLKLNRPYYVAASVNLKQTDSSGITFFVRELTDDGELQTAQAAHQVVGGFGTETALVIGGRDRQSRHQWDGLIDDVRLTQRAIAAEELLINQETAPADLVGFWRFNPEPGLRADSSPNGLDLQPGSVSGSSSAPPALVDYCHVLLNSNEFLYLD